MYNKVTKKFRKFAIEFGVNHVNYPTYLPSGEPKLHNMRIIKRLYLFVLKSFLPVFAMTFFIVLFIVLMQFLWRYIDDLVGKGLGMDVLGELFFYAALTMVPMALPLAILLASLMTFGNLGERSELTAIKASGISLLKVMSPLIILVMLIAAGAFFFQNNVLPKAQVKMYTLLFSMKQKSPEVEIPEDVFYDQIPGYSLFVKTKNRETGMLYNTMIYDVSKGGDNSTILLADSARLAFTNDMRYLYLHLFTGEQFENLREQRSLDQNVPFRRETFYDKEILIPFDANFNRLDEGGMRKQYVGKNIAELRATIDSLNVRIDSIGNDYAYDLKSTAFRDLAGYNYFGKDEAMELARRKREMAFANIQDNFTVEEDVNRETDAVPDADGLMEYEKQVKPFPLDSLLSAMNPMEQNEVYSNAKSINKSRTNEMEYRALSISEEKRSIRRHGIELMKKFTLSVACIIFFFIGAPLGAIIRKGGLGTPLVISVLLFLFYYVIDNMGYKMARDGHIAVWFGIWLSTFILLPLGVFVTYKAMNDSAVFNKDLYLNIIRNLLGLTESRHVPLKEVIINNISAEKSAAMLARDYARASYWLSHNPFPMSYRDYWRGGYDAEAIVAAGEELDHTVNYLSDSRDLKLLDIVERIPVIKDIWIYHPVPKNMKWLQTSLAVLFPVGGIIYLVGLSYGRILRRQFVKVRMQTLAALCRLEAVRQRGK